MNKAIILLIFLATQWSSYATHVDDKKVLEIFNKIVLAYGSPKSAPQLILSDKPMSTPAIYYANPNARIVVDRRFFEICNSIHGYEVDAVATVLSHELAHYYNDHTFCSDFAFAIRNEDRDFSTKLRSLSKAEKISLETEADLKGLFYAASAGYNPFVIYSELLNKIYAFYNITDNVEGYPTKKERISIHLNAEQKVAQLYLNFKQAILAGEKGDYDQAIDKFESLNRHFPSRENYNNIGVYNTLKALSLYPLSRYAYLNPKRFEYPLQLEKDSRLVIDKRIRSNDTKTQQIIRGALLNAQRAFEKSIALDPGYYNSYINLACVYDLLGNPEGALGKIKELPNSIQSQRRVKRIQAIAYYHMEMTEKAEGIWQGLKL